MSTDSGVPPQEHGVTQGFLVLGDDIHGRCGVVCAYGVEVGRGVVVAAAAVAAVEGAIVAAVREDTGAEPDRLAAVAVGDRRASPRQDT